MKRIIIIAAVLFAASNAFAGGLIGDTNNDNRVYNTPTANANATGGTAISGSNSSSSAKVDNKVSNSQEQGQYQGQHQAQSQQNRNVGINGQGQKQSADNNALNSWSYTNVTPEQAASAAGIVVNVASQCGGTGGGSGQSVGAGAAFGFSFEFKDCVVLREAAFLIGLGASMNDHGKLKMLEAALNHVWYNIPRMRKTLESVGYTPAAEVEKAERAPAAKSPAAEAMGKAAGRQ